MLTSTTTDAGGNYHFTNLRAGGNYRITPISGSTNFTPGTRSFTNLAQDMSGHFSGPAQKVQNDSTPTDVCTDAEKARNRDALIDKYSAQWQRSIESEKPRIIAESKARNLSGVNADAIEATATLSPIRFQAVFVKGCTPNMITARYQWHVRLFFKGTIKETAFSKQTTCGKVAGIWFCR